MGSLVDKLCGICAERPKGVHKGIMLCIGCENKGGSIAVKNAEKGCVLPVPYPRPSCPERPVPPQTVYRLRCAAAGREGMLTHQCVWLQRAAACRMTAQKEAADYLETAARLAGVHLGLLAELLLCCGAENAFFVPKSGHKIWWSACCVPSCQKTEFSLSRLLQEVRAAARLCRALAECLPASMQPCAERLLADWVYLEGQLQRALLL